MLGLDRAYPSGAEVTVAVIAIDLQEQPELQAHGFHYAWTCTDRSTGAACLDSSGAALALPASSELRLTAVQQGTVLDFAVQVTKGSSQRTRSGGIVVFAPIITVQDSAPFNICKCGYTAMYL